MTHENKFISPYALAQENRDKISEMKNSINAISSNYQELKKLIAELTNKTTNHGSFNRKSTEITRKLSNRVDDFATHVGTKELRYNTYEDRMNTIEKQLSRLTSDQIAMNERIKGLLDYYNKLITRDDRREKQIGLISDTNNNLIDRIVKLEEITEHLDKDCWGE